MNALMLPAFDGSLLCEGNTVRLVYMDEAGISRDEPNAVVSAVIVHGDTQLRSVEKHLLTLVEKHIPECFRDGFVFHATHIFSGVKGSESLFGRDNPEWPLARRLGIARDLAEIPQLFDLPITFGMANRQFMVDQVLKRQIPHISERDLSATLHGTAFMTCAMNVEVWMRQNASDENCLMLVENNDQNRAFLKSLQNDLQSKSHPEIEGWSDYLPFSHIREDPLFQPKRPFSLLQIADLAAYLFKRKLLESPLHDEFLRLIWPQVVYQEPSPC